MRLPPRETLPPTGFARPSAETPRRVGREAIICADFSPLAAFPPLRGRPLRCADADHRHNPPGRATTATRRARRLRRFPSAVTDACFMHRQDASCALLRLQGNPGSLRVAPFERCRLALLAPRSLPRGLGKERERHGVLLACSRSVAGVSERQGRGVDGCPDANPTNYPAPGNFTQPASLRHFRRRRAGFL